MIEELAQAVVATYDDFSTRHCCSYGLLSNALERTELTKLAVCHDSLRWAQRGVYDTLITSYPANNDLDFQFFDFMKNVLYKKYSDHIHLCQTEDDKSFIQVTDLVTIPPELLFNLCICSRVIVEHREFLWVWSRLVEEGLHPSFAFALCRSGLDTTQESLLDQVVTSSGVDTEHWPFYLKVSLKGLVVDGPNCSQFNFKANPGGCTPTNIIWGEATDLRGLRGHTIREFWTEWKEKLGL